MLRQQRTKDTDLQTNRALLRPILTNPNDSVGAAGERDAERRGAHAVVEDYLDRVCVPFVETLPYAERREMRREIASHLKSLVDAYEELGDPPATATQKALVKFGSPKKVARLWRDSSAMSRVGTGARGRHFMRQARRCWPSVSVTLSALFLFAGLLSPLRPVASGQQNTQTTAPVMTGKKGSKVAVAGLSIAGFHHVEAIQNRNCVDCHRAPVDQGVDQRYLVEQTRQWMESRGLKGKAGTLK